MSKKDKVFVFVGIIIFGLAGIYLTFFTGNINNYDSKARAYEISPNERYDSDGGIVYYPIFYFRVKGEEYECKTYSGSSIYPNENKRTVYYDSSDPKNCKTEYDKSSGVLGGVLCLITSAILFYFAVIKKTSPIKNEEVNQVQDIKTNRQVYIDPEKGIKIIEIVNKVDLISKRVIIGIIFLVVLLFTTLDIGIAIQTIKSKNYIDTTATFVEKKDSENSQMIDYVYVFTDKDGKEHEIIDSYFKDEQVSPNLELRIKYDEKNPKNYYTDSNLMNKSSFIWFIVKIVILILLIITFFSKKILSMMSIFTSRN